jgi:glycosyltransferase involved in cell wall biosynthesis
MKVIIDARNVARTGIGTYTRNLVNGLLDYKELPLDIALAGKPEDIRKFFGGDVKVISLSDSIYSLREQVDTFFMELRNKDSFDFVHYLNYSKSFFSVMPYVVTVHDLIQFRFGYSSKVKQAVGKMVLENAVRNAKAVICVSNFVKNELLNFCKVNENKVFVVHNPVPKISNRDNESEENYTKPFEIYVLCVGNRKPHKNFGVVLRSLEILKDKYPELGLVIVGKKFEKYDYLDKIVETSQIRERVLLLENIPHSYLSFLYRNAILTVSPSLYEGFGFVPFESLQFGTLPLVSNIPVSKELFFDADEDVFFDPHSPSELASKIELFINNSALREQKKRLLSKYLDYYSFDKFISGIVEVYKKHFD